MPLTLTTLLDLAGASMPTSFATEAAKGAKVYLGRAETWLLTVEVTRDAADLQARVVATTDDPDLAPKWAPIETTRRDTGVTAVEHVFTTTGTYELEVRTWGTRAIRPDGCGSAGVGANDAIAIKAALPLAGA